MPKARKLHTCTLCGGEIPKGEQYFYRRIAPWEHAENEGFFTFRAHLLCEKIWEEIGADCDWIFPDAAEFREYALTDSIKVSGCGDFTKEA